MERIPIPYRLMPLVKKKGSILTTSGINPTFAGLYPSKGQVGYALRTRAPVAI